jgi:hypothetical protein
MAGGDGLLAPVAEVALERDAAFVCIPFGTRNYFARDLGLARDDPIGALRAFADGIERRIDVGRADERLFLNNVSLGLYTRLVLVANSAYELELPSLGERERLDASRRRSTASPTCWRRRWSSASSRVRYACSCRRPRAAESTSG